MSRYLNALSVEKSSNWTRRYGKISFIESMNSCIKASIYMSFKYREFIINNIFYLLGVRALAPQSQIEGIINEFLSIGTEVETNRNSGRWSNASTRNI
jgi:hypothetical protein